LPAELFTKPSNSKWVLSYYEFIDLGAEKMTKKIMVLAVAILCLAGLVKSESAFSLEITPFDSFNQSPLVAIYGLPGPGNFLLLPEGRTEAALNTVLSSNHTEHNEVREQIILDGETTRFTLGVRHAFSRRWEVGLKLPYINHSGGFLDSFIENYHQAFGFPQGGRDQAPRNRLLYRYRRDGIERLRLGASDSGLGDLRVTTAWQLHEKRADHQGITANFGLKLPTGESDQLRGSGSTDISLWFAGGTGGRLAEGKWASYGSAGLLFLTEGDVLPEQQRTWVGFGSLGLGWMPFTGLSLKVQADAHSSFFRDSDLKEIATPAVQLILGGTLSFSATTTLDIGVAEDLSVNTAPDVSFYLSLRQGF